MHAIPATRLRHPQRTAVQHDDADASTLTQHADRLEFQVRIFRATVAGEHTYLVVDTVLRTVWKGAVDEVRARLNEQARNT